MLVRPDLHVGWRADLYTPEAAASLCDVLQDILAAETPRPNDFVALRYD